MNEERFNKPDGVWAASEAAAKEAANAQFHWPPFHSVHEGFGVLLEEVDELKAECWQRHPDKGNLRTEAIHVAAMALRFIAELT